MEIKTYKYFDDSILFYLLNCSYSSVYLYKEYEIEAINCQNFHTTSIDNKTNLILISQNLFHIIDCIKKNNSKDDFYYYDKIQLTVNCKWILYNILVVFMNKNKFRKT